MAKSISDSTAEKIRRQLAGGVIKKAIIAGWLKGAGDATVRVFPSGTEGATNAAIMRAKIELDFHVKFDMENAEKERAGYEILAETDEYKGHLVPPLFQELVQDVPQTSVLMLVPFENADRFSDLALDAELDFRVLKRIYRHFLQANAALWRSTQSDSRLNLATIYTKRMRERGRDLAENFKFTKIEDVELTVNDESYGTFGSLFKTFRARLNALPKPLGCTSHGDENATNLMVPKDDVEDEVESGWLMVDYVNTGTRNDWVFSVAKMVQDWDYDQTLRLASKDPKVAKSLEWDVTPKRGKKPILRVRYDRDTLREHRLPISGELEKLTMATAEAFAEECGEGDDWKERLTLARCAVAFGSAPLRMVADPFTTPVLLDQALSCLRS
jgi:hypothetical protein